MGVDIESREVADYTAEIAEAVTLEWERHDGRKTPEQCFYIVKRRRDQRKRRTPERAYQDAYLQVTGPMFLWHSEANNASRR